MPMYWSTEEDISSPFVRGIMSRNYFKKVKVCLHACDNDDLCVDDKWTKLRPLFDIVNKKIIQFGVFAEHLSINEQMVPYFGRHCKRFFRAKPIRFGYKNCVFCSDDGYPFKVIPYQGKAERREGREKGRPREGKAESREGPLGSTVVKNLLDVVTDDRIHDTYFDNFSHLFH